MLEYSKFLNKAVIDFISYSVITYLQFFSSLSLAPERVHANDAMQPGKNPTAIIPKEIV